MQDPKIFSWVCQVVGLDSQQEVVCQNPSAYKYVCIIADVN